MYINRLTIGLKESDRKFNLQQNDFVKVSSYFEEILFNYLPSRINIAGVQFFHVYLYSGPIARNAIKISQHSMDFHFHEISFDLDAFYKSTSLEKINFLADTFEKAIFEVGQHYETDKNDFVQAFLDLRENDPLKIEQTLSLSRTHKSRKLRVDIVRVLEPYKEQLFCRIIDRFETLKYEVLIDPEFVIHALGVYYVSSTWVDNKFVLLNHEDEAVFDLDVSRFLV